MLNLLTEKLETHIPRWWEEKWDCRAFGLCWRFLKEDDYGVLLFFTA